MPVPPASFETPQLLAALRAAGEPTRLRLLALCSGQEHSVSALAEVLGQSEPRVSRHLKQLCQAGLLERLREGAWVRYRVPAAGRELEFVRGLLGRWADTDALRLRDAARVSERADRAATAVPHDDSRLGRSLRRFVTAEMPAGERFACALVVGSTAAELLNAGGAISRRVVVLSESRIAAQRLRLRAERIGADCEVRVADLTRIPALVRAIGLLPPLDAVIADRLGASAAEMTLILRALRARLAAGGRISFFVRYDSLGQGRGKVVEHPLAHVRRLLGEAGFACDRLQPIEADGEHVIAAAATCASFHERVA